MIKKKKWLIFEEVEPEHQWEAEYLTKMQDIRSRHHAFLLFVVLIILIAAGYMIFIPQCTYSSVEYMRSPEGIDADIPDYEREISMRGSCFVIKYPNLNPHGVIIESDVHE